MAASQSLAASPASPTAQPDARPAPVSDADLAEMSGGEATLPAGVYAVLTNQNLTATDSNNGIYAGGNVSSGNVDLGQNAFQGFGGIGNFVFNTGHNNNLQGALSVAINMVPTGTQ